MMFNLSEVQELIRRRRTIRPARFSPRKVQRDQIEKMLEAANWAPTHGRTEPWRFKVYAGEPLKQLMQTWAEIYKAITPSEKFLQEKYEDILARRQQCSAAILVWLKRQESEAIPEMEEWAACACAIQNISLVCTAYGMGCFWSTGPVCYSQQLHQHLGLGPKDRVVGLLYLGYPQGEWPEGKRGIWMNKTEWYGF
ncbi:MAG: nitroreductase [Flavobacteriales bacterium]|nr:nitroreductase [Flavobacteriales bacterium]MDW8433065.1 nitroreductase [Flavobacteriales bacterium]